MDNIKETPLCKLAYKYGTDKCPRIGHNYTPFYYHLLKGEKNSIRKVLEVGIGTYRTMKNTVKSYNQGLRRYQKGASLKMWRDFFPKAQIFGADILPDAMFKSERIRTFLCDETKEKDIKNLVKRTGTDIDLFIDDGSHAKEYQVFLARTILPLLDDKVIYIIEDVGFPNFIKKSLDGYECHVPKIQKIAKNIVKDKLIIVRKI